VKLITLKHHEDYGHNWYVQVLHTKQWALFQCSVSWMDFPSWPYLQIKSGTGSTLSILFWAYRFGIDVGIIERTWNWDCREDSEIKEEKDQYKDWVEYYYPEEVNPSPEDCMPPWGHSDLEYLAKNKEDV